MANYQHDHAFAQGFRLHGAVDERRIPFSNWARISVGRLVPLCCHARIAPPIPGSSRPPTVRMMRAIFKTGLSTIDDRHELWHDVLLFPDCR